MQPIERYGVIALLFLMITIGAVVIWGPESDVGATAGHAPASAASRTQPPLARERGAAQQRPSRPPLSTSANSLLLASRKDAAQRGNPQAVQTRDARGFQGSQADAAARNAARSGGLPATKAAAQRKPPLGATGSNSVGGRGGGARSASPALAGSARQAGSGSASARVYEIQPGDTLSEIAQAELGEASRWREITALNPRVVPERLKTGDKLLMPARGARSGAGTRAAPAGSRARAASAGTPAGTSNGIGTYQVRPGDTLGQIAADHLGSWTRWKEIAALNPGVDPKALQAGQSLVLPTGTIASARTTTPEWSPTGRGGVR